MHVLRYLADPTSSKSPKGSLQAEYRLLCSGALHREVIGDWSKSEGARFLLDEPLVLFVASRPFDDYPQELVLHLTVPHVEETETRGKVKSTHSYHPDGEIAQDLGSLLSLLCRRLITVAGKTRESYADHAYPRLGHVPLPLASKMRRVFWPPHPLVLSSSLRGTAVEDYNPPSSALDGAKLTALLTNLPSIPHAAEIVRSARLYALSLELLRDQPEIAYQLLISAVETMASAVLKEYQPDDASKVKHHEGVFKCARTLGLCEEQASQVAIEACRREFWIKRKFKKLLLESTDVSFFETEDDLFKLPAPALPSRENLEATLGRIYDARSHATHLGERFPALASHAGGPQLSVQAVNELLANEVAIPPVAWFERLVNTMLRKNWERSLEPKKP